MNPEYLELLTVAAKALQDFKDMHGTESATFNLAQNALDTVILGETGRLP